MCCFSKSVEEVFDTNIFARDAQGAEQFLVYSMQFAAAEDLAMVLPLPVPPGSSEDAVHFISLEQYPDFFTDLKKGFPVQLPRSAIQPEAAAASPSLEVVQVGGFDASFVPTVADFARLDERFRLPAGTWERLPAYRDYGFAVFKLRKETQAVHPMAFRFPRRDPGRLFFPTVHIHDGEVHHEAYFDHMLYCQPRAEAKAIVDAWWEESLEPARTFIKPRLAQGIVDWRAPCYRRPLFGTRRNEDTWV
ncbi:hypothetical protein JY651_05915 [Pyxidicoccus parkwayensis]|uniref:Uncharacterized protein n=1 Tax=Pyxidicoccus parkwayensis TaxID=2813578 RepID=A0ABX7P239_9BACT|nr:hypothetical protein [Pyxidicoccus parkwaysis]QSQ24487.1 hypothetical protein JY651_05915 [Pyxidicoccus parkwaysis]